MSTIARRTTTVSVEARVAALQESRRGGERLWEFQRDRAPQSEPHPDFMTGSRRVGQCSSPRSVGAARAPRGGTARGIRAETALLPLVDVNCAAAPAGVQSNKDPEKTVHMALLASPRAAEQSQCVARDVHGRMVRTSLAPWQAVEADAALRRAPWRQGRWGSAEPGARRDVLISTQRGTAHFAASLGAMREGMKQAQASRQLRARNPIFGR